MAASHVHQTPPFIPGDVVALLSQVDDIEPGLYLLSSVVGEWAVLKLLIDDEVAERLFVTQVEVRLPVKLLSLFTSVGLRLSPMQH